MTQDPNAAVERVLQRAGSQVSQRSQAELRDQLVAPDFADIASRVLRKQPDFWTQAQRTELAQLPHRLLHGTEALEDIEGASPKREDFGPEFSRVFASLRTLAQDEAQQLQAQQHSDPAPEQEKEPWWQVFGSWLGLSSPRFAWGTMACAALALLWWQLPGGTWASMTQSFTGGSIAEYFDHRSDLRIKVKGANGKTGSAIIDAPRQPTGVEHEDLVLPITGADNRGQRLGIQRPLPSYPVVDPTDASAKRSEVATPSRPDASSRKRSSIAQLEARAARAWRSGAHHQALGLYRRVIRRAPRSKHAELAWADIFLLLREIDAESERRDAWSAYLKSFPKGRFAQHASAGLCRSAPADQRPGCWKKHRLAYPKGVYDEM